MISVFWYLLSACIYRSIFLKIIAILNTLCYTCYNMMKKCKIHELAKHFERKDGSWRCGKCASKWVINSRRKKKAELVKMFGGKCRACSYNRYIGALDFHHTNPSDKAFALSVRGLCYAWKDVLKEARKCVLLCKNCHAEVENGIRKI